MTYVFTTLSKKYKYVFKGLLKNIFKRGFLKDIWKSNKIKKKAYAKTKKTHDEDHM